MWKQLIESLTPECSFEVPATWASVTLAEEKFGVQFPSSLRALLFETNGVRGEYGLGLIWPIERIVADNLLFRTDKNFKELYMPFDSLLFFADTGSGDQFAFPIHANKIRRDDIFAWNHENDSRSWVAPSLATYLEWWMNGNLTL